mmetsp:Transcript_40270/g.64713  ORF Transcript_40270/g.64713 Transcript_40270/m.64713 type:complete len:82 (-) Transcript_40270:1254-1499(-)
MSDNFLDGNWGCQCHHFFVISMDDDVWKLVFFARFLSTTPSKSEPGFVEVSIKAAPLELLHAVVYDRIYCNYLRGGEKNLC